PDRRAASAPAQRARRGAAAGARRRTARRRVLQPGAVPAVAAGERSPGRRRGVQTVARERLMADTLAPKLALARAVGTPSRLRRGGATGARGKVLMRLAPHACGALGARLRRGSVLISATNGKTTTATIAAGILERAGMRLVHNRAGANMAGGIAAALLAAARPREGMDGELGLFEVDELWLDRVSAELHPRAIVLANLFRDQLDRYGELETI